MRPCDGGPVSLQIRRFHTRFPGKPPHINLLVDMEAANDSTEPVWIALDPSITEYPVHSVTLLGAHSLGAPFVWSFEGVNAIRVPSSSHVLLSEVRRDARRDDRVMSIVVARRLLVAGWPAQDWLGQSGLIPARGEVRFEESRLDVIAERRFPGEGPAEVRVIDACRIDFELPAGLR